MIPFTCDRGVEGDNLHNRIAKALDKAFPRKDEVTTNGSIVTQDRMLRCVKTTPTTGVVTIRNFDTVWTKQDLDRMGVTTPQELDHYFLWAAYCDIYEDCHNGFNPSGNWKDYTPEQINEMLADLRRLHPVS